MAALFSLLSNAAAKTLDRFLLRINMTPPKTEPFCFLDLPTEIRYMIYEHLKHDVKIELPDLGLPGCTTDVGLVENCFYPSVMLVCHQIRSEYTTVTPSAMILSVWFGAFGVDDIRERPRDTEACLPALPQRVLAQITRLDMRVHTGRGRPHCGMLFKRYSINNPLLTLTYDVDYLPAIQNLYSRLIMMSQASFTCSFYIDQAELDHPGEFDRYRGWIEKSLEFFPTMTCARDCSMRVAYEIRCELFSPWFDNPGHVAEDDIEYPTTEVVFSVHAGSAEETFKFHNLHLMFLGEEEILDSSNW
jgi:hypothetical protein